MNIDIFAGYKAKAAGIGMMFTGLGIAINCIVTKDYSEMVHAIEAFGMGLAAFGIRLAQDRLAVKP